MALPRPMFARSLVLGLLAVPLLADAASYTCRVNGRTLFQEVPCGAAATGPGSSAGNPKPAPPPASPVVPPQRVFLCMAPNGDLGFEHDGCGRGSKPIEAQLFDTPSTQAPIPMATKPGQGPVNTFGEPPDPTATWTQHSRVPADVVEVVVRMRSLYGQYEVSAESDLDGRHRIARANVCLRDARPFDFLDLYKLARPAPHLPPACKLGDFKLAPGRIDYRSTCTQRGRPVVMNATVFMTKTGVRHEQTVVTAAPSDYIRGNRVFELRRVGDCP